MIHATHFIMDGFISYGLMFHVELFKSMTLSSLLQSLEDIQIIQY